MGDKYVADYSGLVSENDIKLFDDREKNKLDQSRAAALVRTVQLAGMFEDLPGVVDRVRATDNPKTAKGIKKAVERLFQLLDIQPDESSVLPEVVDAAPLPNDTSGDTELSTEKLQVNPDDAEHLEVVSRAGRMFDDWLAVFTQFNTEDLSGVDKDRLVEAIVGARGAITHQGKRSINYSAILRQYSTGMSVSELAKLNGKSKVAIYNSLNNFAKEILSRNNGQKLALEDLLGQPGGAKLIPKPAPPTVKLTPIVEHYNSDASLSVKKERQKVLQSAIEHPEIIGKNEWLDAAGAQVIDVAVSEAGMSESEASALWARLHYDDESNYAAELTPEGKSATLKLQDLFIRSGRAQRLRDRKPEHVAMRTLVVTSLKPKNLDDVRGALRVLLGSEPSKSLTQRYAVSAAVEIMRNDN